MAQGVWVVAEERDGEIRKITYEVISEGRRLADALGHDLTAVLLGSNIKDKAGELGQYGADRVLVADDPRLDPYTTDAYVSVVSQLVKANDPALLLMGASVQGKDSREDCPRDLMRAWLRIVRPLRSRTGISWPHDPFMPGRPMPR